MRVVHGRGWRAVMTRALAVTLLAGGLAACADTSSDGQGRSDRDEELFGAAISVVDDEVWVFGGSSGPGGSSPPVTGILPAGWGPNRKITHYAADGSVTQRLELPASMPGSIVGGRLVGDDAGKRWLIGNLCDVGVGCGTDVDPFLARIDGEQVERVALDLPAVDFGNEVGVGFLTVLGQVAGTVWALQEVGGSSVPDYVEPQRLLAIDLATGRGVDVPLPADVYGPTVVCLGDRHLHVAQADLDERLNLTAVRLLRRPATVEPAEWLTIAEMAVDRGYVGGGALQCVESSRELMLTLYVLPTEVMTFEMRTGAKVSTHTMPTESGGALLVGEIADAALVTSRTETGGQQLWRYRSGSWLRLDEAEPARDAVLVVVDGRLVDAQDVLRSFRSAGGRLVVVPT
ncbi:MAG: hypothetical protein ACT4OV_13670 [Microthrixaceae bacterium]